MWDHDAHLAHLACHRGVLPSPTRALHPCMPLSQPPALPSIPSTRRCVGRPQQRAAEARSQASRTSRSRRSARPSTSSTRIIQVRATPRGGCMHACMPRHAGEGGRGTEREMARGWCACVCVHAGGRRGVARHQPAFPVTSGGRDCVAPERSAPLPHAPVHHPRCVCTTSQAPSTIASSRQPCAPSALRCARACSTAAWRMPGSPHLSASRVAHHIPPAPNSDHHVVGLPRLGHIPLAPRLPLRACLVNGAAGQEGGAPQDDSRRGRRWLGPH